MQESKDSIKLTGHIDIKLFGPDGRLKDSRDIKNVIVTVGKNFLANHLASSSPVTDFMQYLEIGTGTDAAQATDTDLQIAIGTRISGTRSDSTNIWENEGTFGAGIGTGAITEAGLFSNSVTATGTMFARQVFPVVNKQAGDSLQIIWQVTLS